MAVAVHWGHLKSCAVSVVCSEMQMPDHGRCAHAGMCRAHGIAHQRVTERGDLRKALQAAWALNKHSVVEVITQRDSNVTHHRRIQERVRRAVLSALRAVSPPAGARTRRHAPSCIR